MLYYTGRGYIRVGFNIPIKQKNGDILTDKHIVLASASPRRKALLEDFGFDFETCASGADEDGTDGMSPADTVKTLALRKAMWVKQRRADDNSIFLGADTLVYANGALLGKPKDSGDAFRMLSALSGTFHEVYTGMALLRGEKQITCAECTRVFFRNLSPDEIRAYIASGEPADKAGAYGIQGKGGLFVSRIEGDYFNVLGLPVCRLYQILRDF